jgi:uncharacterized damage-inducible protein DinB
VTPTDLLIRDNIRFLHQGLDLLGRIDDDAYQHTSPPLYESNVGAHFRHILDHYARLAGDGDTGHIDYDRRSRHTPMESDRSLAIASLKDTIDLLSGLAGTAPATALRVHSRTSAHTPDAQVDTPSTLARELLFLISHTVHHYALIAFILRSQEVQVPVAFGLSPSTLEFLEAPTQHAAG